MLANTTRSIEEIIRLHNPEPKNNVESKGFSKSFPKNAETEDKVERILSESVSQFKYDGQRAQIHLKDDGKFKIFSRHNDDITQRFPDVLISVRNSLANRAKVFLKEPFCFVIFHRKFCQESILDAEICGVDRLNNNKLLSFQQFSTRAKKADTAQVSIILFVFLKKIQQNPTESIAQDQQVSVCVFLFDLLYCDGESFLGVPLRLRARKLRQIFTETPGAIEFATEMACTGKAEMDEFLQSALRAGTEGLVVKLLDSLYIPGKRGNLWLKLKPDYSDSMGDTIEVVPIGAWYGNGRKAGWFSPFLLAVYDPEMEQYQTLCRCMSGFTDEFYKEKTKFYEEKKIAPQPMMVRGEAPSVWFQPSEVWEVRGAELTVSPIHKAGEGLIHNHLGKGLSIRFPRFIRVREDRDVHDTTTPEQLVSLFKSQVRQL